MVELQHQGERKGRRFGRGERENFNIKERETWRCSRASMPHRERGRFSRTSMLGKERGGFGRGEKERCTLGCIVTNRRKNDG